MPKLIIHLREGFFETSVQIIVNGVERFRSPSVTTRMQIGMAEMISLDVPEGLAQIEVRFPELEGTVQDVVRVDEETHFGVDLDENGAAITRTQNQPFRYL